MKLKSTDVEGVSVTRRKKRTRHRFGSGFVRVEKEGKGLSKGERHLDISTILQSKRVK